MGGAILVSSQCVTPAIHFEKGSVIELKMKRILSLLLALMLVSSLMGGAVLMAAAAEGVYEPTDAYVLNYTNEDIPGYEAYDEKRLYASDHYAGLYIDDDGDGELENWNWTCCSVLNMINTAKLSAGGEGAWASIPVYCVDAVTDGSGGHAYRRINLEDSGYFGDDTAGRLRAICLNSFPHVTDMTELAANVNGWISDGEFAEVVNLQESEAITATQIAIWALSNDVTVYEPYLGTGGYYEEDEMVQANLSVFRQGETEYTGNNIRALYAYLMALDGVKVRNPVISDAAFGEQEVRWEKQENGTYKAEITAEVTARVDSGDDLKLTAVCGEAVSKSVEITDGTHTYTLTLTGLQDNAEDVTVNIDGQQDAADVFLFDPEDGRHASQSMIGYDDSTLAVHAEISTSPDRILNIYKTGKDGTTGLENISFDIYEVCSVKDYVNGNVILSPKPTANEIREYAIPANKVATITTNADGFATYNFGQDDKIYLIVEQENNVIVSPVEPFYVAVPGGDSENLEYTVNVYPKNTVIDEDVQIEKDVTEIDNDHDTFDVGEHHSWIIQSSIPQGLATGKLYAVTDTLDYRLDLVGVDKVTVAFDNGTFDPETDPEDKTEDAAGAEAFELIPDEDYTVSLSEVSDKEGRSVDQFIVSLTPAGMAKAAEYVGADYENYEIRIYFTACINSDAGLGEEIPNEAHVDYTNNVGTDYDADSDVPEVHTGGLKLIKVDAVDGEMFLAGASFRIARAAAEGEMPDDTITVNGEKINIVYAWFHADAAMEAEKVTEVTTGADGIALFYGLAYGEYYLIETAAPGGYNQLTEPVAVTINASSHLDDDAETEEIEGSSVTVKNSAKFILPATGGVGTAMFAAVGITLIAGAMMLVVLPARKKSL